MTRDFYNQRREDSHSDSRSSSSRRFEEERHSRPTRPRLNRDMVDRGWENGARQNHPDYRTRSDRNTHPPRDNRRPDQHTNRYSSQTSSNGRNPYAKRQDNYQPGERSPQGNNRHRPRSFESNKSTFDGQLHNQYERRGYSKQPYREDSRPGNSTNSQHPNSSTPYQGREQYRRTQRHDQTRDASSSRNFDRDQRQKRGYESDTRQPHSYDRDKRPSRNTSGASTRNTRWQSHPERRQNNHSDRSHAYARYKADQQLFEGDYEHFDRSNLAQAQNTQTHIGDHRPEERKVTQLQDGRVLKGKPGAQQKSDKFWTEIGQESDELLKQAESSAVQETATKQSVNPPLTASKKRKTNSRTHNASEPAREKKSTKTKVRQSTTSKPRSTGPKPSQRGFKWPTAEE
ncbi:MAG TPA: hypothetical protein VEH81_04785 [Ktedonobacteraceae bacterium]|nr:hypothetical protein [Ktedonobacteraceae bacterium]